MTWDELQPTLESLSSVTHYWTLFAIYCSNTEQDCQNYWSYPILGRDCQMPKIVERLREQNKPIIKAARQEAHITLSQNEKKNPYLLDLYLKPDSEPTVSCWLLETSKDRKLLTESNSSSSKNSHFPSLRSKLQDGFYL